MNRKSSLHIVFTESAGCFLFFRCSQNTVLRRRTHACIHYPIIVSMIENLTTNRTLRCCEQA
ncbi:hypothetical protein, partial [Kingella kingae]|uniref:hypothetical protein n=1 Tax=Kingella kingae TaxID=504 RepID=UPI001E42907F